MSPTLYHEFAVTLKRSGPNTAWGIRLAGGSDLNAPLIIIRVISILYHLFGTRSNLKLNFHGLLLD